MGAGQVLAVRKAGSSGPGWPWPRSWASTAVKGGCQRGVKDAATLDVSAAVSSSTQDTEVSEDPS